MASTLFEPVSFYYRLLGHGSKDHGAIKYEDNELQNLKRDIQNLFNTKQIYEDQCHSILSNSLLSYGLPNLKKLSLTSLEDQENFKQAVNLCIQRHEPRLTEIEVHLADNKNKSNLCIQFTINAIMTIKNNAMPIYLASQIELLSQNISIRDICYD